MDIGGSGCRAARIELSPDGLHTVGQVHTLKGVASRGQLALAVRSTLGPVDRLGISTAGFVDAEAGVVKLSRLQPWAEGHLRDRMERELQCRVSVLNDGEAHLLAHVATSPHPVLCFSIGTSVSFGCTDDAGRVRRPRSGSNWDIGAIRLPTRASNPELWWALGSSGLRELQDDRGETEGAGHYGWRLGALLHDFSVIFQPRTVVLCGGVIDRYGPVIVQTAQEEFSGRWSGVLDPPTISISPFGSHSALVGAAVAASTAG